MAYKEEKDFQVGEECIYSEDGGMTRCRILERDLLEDKLSLRLEALEVIRESRIVLPPKVGDIFEVSKTLGVCVPILLWEIGEVI